MSRFRDTKQVASRPDGAIYFADLAEKSALGTWSESPLIPRQWRFEFVPLAVGCAPKPVAHRNGSRTTHFDPSRSDTLQSAALALRGADQQFKRRELALLWPPLLPRHRDADRVLWRDEVVQVFSGVGDRELHAFDCPGERIAARAVIRRDRGTAVLADITAIIC